MKSLIKYFVLIATAVMLLILNGCESNPCENVPCLNGGACQDGTCICPDGFTGENCELTIDPCNSITCMNGGNCMNGDCECPNGWGGEFCEIQLPQRMIINRITVTDFPITRPSGANWPSSSTDPAEPNIYVTVNDDVFSSDINQTVVESDAIPADGPFIFDTNNSPNMPFPIINVQNKNVAISLWHYYYSDTFSSYQEILMGGYIVYEITDSYPDTSIRIYDPNTEHQIDMTIEVEWEF